MELEGISPMTKKVSNSQMGFEDIFHKQMEQMNNEMKDSHQEIFSDETNIVFASEHKRLVAETGNTFSTPKNQSQYTDKKQSEVCSDTLLHLTKSKQKVTKKDFKIPISVISTITVPIQLKENTQRDNIPLIGDVRKSTVRKSIGSNNNRKEEKEKEKQSTAMFMTVGLLPSRLFEKQQQQMENNAKTMRLDLVNFVNKSKGNTGRTLETGRTPDSRNVTCNKIRNSMNSASAITLNNKASQYSEPQQIISINTMMQGIKVKSQKLNKECFDTKVMLQNVVQITTQLDYVSNHEQLQVILLKLWDLGKYIKFNSKVNTMVPMAIRRQQKLMMRQKVSYMCQKLETVETVPLRVLSVSEIQNLLAKIALSIYIVIESALSINNQILNLDKLDKIALDKDEIEFKHFKPLVLSLFGINLFKLSSIDIDSILRKVHRELIVIIGEKLPPPDQNQECAKRQIKKVTDEDLANLCKSKDFNIVDPISQEARNKNKNELIAKKKIISINDLIDHVGRVKFNKCSYHVREAHIKDLMQIIKKIFPKANLDIEEAALPEKKKNISKVRQHILSMNQEPPIQISQSHKTLDAWNIAKKRGAQSRNYTYNTNPTISKTILNQNSSSSLFPTDFSQDKSIKNLIPHDDKLINPKISTVLQTYDFVNKFGGSPENIDREQNKSFHARRLQSANVNRSLKTLQKIESSQQVQKIESKNTATHIDINQYTNQKRLEKQFGKQQNIWQNQEKKVVNLPEKPKLLNKKETNFSKMAKQTNKNVMKTAFNQMKIELAPYGFEEIKHQPKLEVNDQFLQSAEKNNLGVIFSGSQGDARVIYSPKQIDRGIVSSNISNYQQKLQQVSFQNPKQQIIPKKSISRSYYMDKKYLKPHIHRYHQKSDLKEASRDIKISNYLRPQNLIDSENVVYNNSTMHNYHTKALVETLNKNEIIRQSDSDIPRFGVQGNHQEIRMMMKPQARTIKSAIMRFSKVQIPQKVAERSPFGLDGLAIGSFNSNESSPSPFLRKAENDDQEDNLDETLKRSAYANKAII